MPFSPVQIALFFVANLVEPYLEMFQADKPMVTFMQRELNKIIQNLLGPVVKHSVLAAAKNLPQKWSHIDLQIEENLIPVKNLQFGLAVEKVLSDIRKKDHVDSNQMKAFLVSARTFLVSMLGKLFERSPICPTVVLDPNVLFNNEKDGLVKRFRIMLKSIIKLAIMPAHKASIERLVDLMKSSPHTFSEKSVRLDDYYFSQFNITKHGDFSFVKLALTLSHGQATVQKLNDERNSRLILDYIEK